MMKKSLRLLTAGALTIAVLASMSVNAMAETTKKTIVVSGNGYVIVKPDVAYLNLGVTTESDDPKIAQEKNNAQMNKVIEAVKNAGVAEKDIQTSNFSIYPNYDYSEKGGNKIIGYQVNNSISVKVRDITKSGTVLDAALTAGANSNSGINFSVANPDDFYEAALDKAIQNGMKKAGAVAKSLKVTIGAPVNVTENVTYGSPIPMMANSKAANNAGNADTSIQPGELEISASVQMTFEY